MGRKKNSAGDQQEPMPTTAPPKSRTKDRHKARRQLALTPELYDQLQKLADRNRRPLLWEGRLAIEKHLEENGLWPPTAD